MFEALQKFWVASQVGGSVVVVRRLPRGLFQILRDGRPVWFNSGPHTSSSDGCPNAGEEWETSDLNDSPEGLEELSDFAEDGPRGGGPFSDSQQQGKRWGGQTGG